jgi:hypothetical protein
MPATTVRRFGGLTKSYNAAGSLVAKAAGIAVLLARRSSTLPVLRGNRLSLGIARRITRRLGQVLTVADQATRGVETSGLFSARAR